MTSDEIIKLVQDNGLTLHGDIEHFAALVRKCPWVEQAEKRKPVAWMYVNFDDECEQIEYGEPFDDPSVTPLYAAPPARKWVGLTDEEVEQVFPAIATYHAANKTLYRSIARAIEAKLQEKNHG